MKGSDLMPIDDWEGEEIPLGEQLYANNNELFTGNKAKKYLQHLVEDMGNIEAINILTDWGAENID